MLLYLCCFGLLSTTRRCYLRKALVVHMVLFEKWLPRGSVGAAVLARSQAAAAPTTPESSTPRGSVGAAILARSQAAAAASADELVEPQPPVGGRVFYRFSCCLCEHDIWLNFKPVPSQPVAGEFEPCVLDVYTFRGIRSEVLSNYALCSCGSTWHEFTGRRVVR